MAGGYEHTFLDAPEDLKCPVCLYVCKDPHQVECCGKVFCKACISRVKERSNVCPNCRRNSFNIFKDGRSRRDIKRLRVSCSNEGNGCDWSGQLEDHDKHRRECGFEEVYCLNEECDASVQARLLDKHLKDECPGRKVECQVCQGKIPHVRMDNHPNVCPKVEVECPNSGCSVKLCRDQLISHTNVCSKQNIACPYKISGCRVTMLREDKEKHLLEYVHEHSSISNSTVLTLKQDLRATRDSLQSRSVPPVTFKMNDYKRKKDNRMKWHSPCFYSHPNGYKMQLEVDASSEDIPDSVSVFVYFVDAHESGLVWPFKGTITMKILNQQADSRHHSKTMVMDSDVEYIEFEHVGYPDFISHAKLEDLRGGKLLKDDCVYFQVSSVTVDKDCKPWLAYSPSVESLLS